MKMCYFRHPKAPNFGDELNPWLWPKLLGNVFDEDESAMFHWDRIGPMETIIPRTPANTSWARVTAPIRLLRSSTRRGSSVSCAVRRQPKPWGWIPGRQSRTARSFYARCTIADRSPSGFERLTSHTGRVFYTGDWERVCRWAGVNLIDPRDPVEQVLEEIAASEVVVAEAMHGAIVADNLRVPWIPVLPLATIHRFKWTDWTRSLGLEYLPHHVAPSSWIELEPALSRLRQRWFRTRNVGPAKSALTPRPRRMLDSSLCAAAATRLRWLSTREPILSRDTVIADLSERALEKVHAFSRIHSRSAA